ncbi:hypothetical protein PRIPAC_79251 [Pristionchus pacificus]|uniref:Uncharacterized protein n=1 Tax=Pristionchus pacificus TaxID=54126 RepID=A0A2A6BH41_PRIPA|nr:hypothetical protein PRIPAC_79251 [Pristionchus pacificus]|eukprot:PDM65168.1 hypothetical protein PRIPAC_52110 [Pristionchus pacificus]
MAPNFSTASFNHEMNRAQSTTDDKPSLIVLTETNKKYMAEFNRLQEQKRELEQEMSKVADIINKDYPDLPLARIVRNDGYSRNDDEQRLRVRIFLKKMSRKARNMIADALDDELDMKKCIERGIKMNLAELAAVEITWKIEARKRPARASEETEEKTKRPRIE